ncbi:MAG: serine/threonine-protein kinase [Pirellulaceae bacterium]|nr:serine/threonine-protein kinase [Pirellulaceae bacterium]
MLSARQSSEESLLQATSVLVDDTTTCADQNTSRRSTSDSHGIDEDEKNSPPNRLGRFELITLLGEGGFGKVWKAFDPQLERFVALKVPTFASSAVDRQRRFISEAKAAARLKHPNIVATFDSGRIDDSLFIAAEYVEGGSLAGRMKNDSVSFEQAASWIRDLTRALDYAHHVGIVHRDIKPHNVLLDKQSNPKLTDFGLAKRLDDDSELTTEGALLGTPAYMSPEQARGETSLIGPPATNIVLGSYCMNY